MAIVKHRYQRTGPISQKRLRSLAGASSTVSAVGGGEIIDITFDDASDNGDDLDYELSQSGYLRIAVDPGDSPSDAFIAESVAASVTAHDGDSSAHTGLVKLDGSRPFTAPVAGVTPTDPAHLVTVAYLDSAIQGVEWQDTVLDRDLTAPPGGESAGDRYIVASVATDLWATHEDEIAEWLGASWDFTAPTTGMSVGIDDENRNIRWNGATWVFFGTTVDHGNLAGKDDPSDHIWASLVDGTRAFTGAVGGVNPVAGTDLATKNSSDTAATTAADSATSTHNSSTAAHVGLVKVDGTRDFTGNVGGIAPVDADHLTRRDYVDSKATSEANSAVSTHDGAVASHSALSRVDGSRPFTAVVSGVTPTLDAHIATKGYTDGQASSEASSAVSTHDGTVTAHAALTRIDGSRAFTAVVSGVTPTLDAHLATKGSSDAAATAAVAAHDALAGAHAGLVKVDGSRAITGTISGIDPTASTHLVTRNYSDSQLNTHKSDTAAHTGLVKTDGSRAFTGNISGITPTDAAHLARRDYVDTSTSDHNSSSSAHTGLLKLDGSRIMTGGLVMNGNYILSSLFTEVHAKYSGGTPLVKWDNVAQGAVDEHIWVTRNYADGTLHYEAWTDGGTAASYMVVDRSGGTPTEVNLIPDTRITGDLEVEGGAATITGSASTFCSVEADTVQAGVIIWNKDATVDNGRWLFRASGDSFHIMTLTDSGGLANAFMGFERTANIPDLITFGCDIDLQGSDLTTTGDVSADYVIGNVIRIGAGGPALYTNTLAPNGNVSADPGDRYVRTGATAEYWFKATGAGNTGWVQIA